MKSVEGQLLKPILLFLVPHSAAMGIISHSIDWTLHLDILEGKPVPFL